MGDTEPSPSSGKVDKAMQNRNSLRLIAAAIVALLVAYLRMTGYLPESGQEASYEDQAEAESEYEV